MWPGKTRPLPLSKLKLFFMANMSYCRFRNTLLDLNDCYYNLDEADISIEEFVARKQLIELCVAINDEWSELADEEWNED
jgi:hypothetical protein